MSLRHTILALLEADERTGYDLAKQFQGTFGHFWSASHQQIYQELAKLSESGCVSFEEIAQTGKPGKKVYRPTDKGREELVDWINKPIVETKIRDELLVRMVASHLVPVDVIRKHLLSTKNKREERLNTYICYEKMLAEQNKLPLAEKNKLSNVQQTLVFYSVQWGIRALQSWITWAEEVLNFLERQQEDTVSEQAYEALPAA